MSGVFIHFMILLTVCRMPSKASRIRYVRWSLKIIASCMTGWWMAFRLPVSHGNMSSRGCRRPMSNVQTKAVELVEEGSLVDGMTLECPASLACVDAA